jgi:hypothetical protein
MSHAYAFPDIPFPFPISSTLDNILNWKNTNGEALLVFMCFQGHALEFWSKRNTQALCRCRFITESISDIRDIKLKTKDIQYRL